MAKREIDVIPRPYMIMVNFEAIEVVLNKLSQLGTERVPHGGKHFWKVYGGF